MELEKPELLHLAGYGLRLVERVQQILDENAPTDAPVSLAQMDQLIADSKFFKELAEDLGEISKTINKANMRLEQLGGSYLKALGREDYKSPQGSIAVKGKWHVNMPETLEDKLALFDYLKEKEMFDTLATVHSGSLNSYYLKEYELAIAEDPDNAVLFSLPGLKPAVWNEFTQIKGQSGRKKKKEETDNE